MRALRLALARANLRRLLGAGLVSLTGDWILRVGLAYSVFALTGSTLVSAATLLASFLPQVLLGSVAGVFVDRWDTRRTMVVSNLLLAAGLLPLLAVHEPDQVWIVYAVTAWEGCVQQFFTPAQQSLLPRLVDGDGLLTANAINGQTVDVSRLAGSALGGVLAATGGIAAVTVVDTVSFLVAAMLIARIDIARRAAPALEGSRSARAALSRLCREWAEGLRLSTRDRVLRTLGLFLLVTTFGEGIMGTLFAPFVRTVLHGDAAAYGAIMAAQAIGGIAGGLIVASIGGRLSPAKALGSAAIAFGGIDLVLFLYPEIGVALWPATACMIAAGLPGALIMATAMTLLQRNSAEAHRGRIFGALGTVEGVAVVAGTIVAGVLGGAVGIVPVLVAQGAGYVIGGLLVLAGIRESPHSRTASAEREGFEPSRQVNPAHAISSRAP